MERRSGEADLAPHALPARRDRWNFQLLYTLGRDRELRRPPYRAILREKPLSFRVKNLVKCAFPALHRLYRERQGYNE